MEECIRIDDVDQPALSLRASIVGFVRRKTLNGEPETGNGFIYWYLNPVIS